MDRVIVLRTEQQRARALALFAGLDIRHTPPWEIVLRETKAKRTTEQNKRMWAILREISEQLEVGKKLFSDEAWHEFFKRTFIGATEVDMPDGTTELHGISTTTLSVPEFGDYMTQMEAYSTSRGVVFSDDADRAFRELAQRAS